MNNKLQKFADSMQAELEANKHKGNWENFINPEEIHSEIQYHMDKLKAAESWTEYNFSEEIAKTKIKEYVADCANLLLMLGNSYGVYEK